MLKVLVKSRHILGEQWVVYPNSSGSNDCNNKSGIIRFHEVPGPCQLWMSRACLQLCFWTHWSGSIRCFSWKEDWYLLNIFRGHSCYRPSAGSLPMKKPKSCAGRWTDQIGETAPICLKLKPHQSASKKRKSRPGLAVLKTGQEEPSVLWPALAVMGPTLQTWLPYHKPQQASLTDIFVLF